MKRVLNVGGGSKDIAISEHYAGWEHVLLDIDARQKPDVVCDARSLASLPAELYDAIYCSHNLEHYYQHEVPRVLAGFLHVLKDEGFAQIRVPDLQELMRVVTEREMDVEDVLYQSPAGPVRVLDVVYGFAPEIERSGLDFFAHKTGFTRKSLLAAVQRAGFQRTYSTAGNLEIKLVAFKQVPDRAARALFNLPED